MLLSRAKIGPGRDFGEAFWFVPNKHLGRLFKEKLEMISLDRMLQMTIFLTIVVKKKKKGIVACLSINI